MTNTELILLGLLAESPKHGYQLEQDIAQHGMREWTEIGFSSIYYILNKLEASALLASVKEDPGGHPARKVYHLTAQGTQALRQAVLERVGSPRPHTSDFDLALANLGVLEPSAAAAALRAHREDLTAQIARVADKARRDRESGIPWFVDELFNHSLAILQAELEWINDLIPRLPADQPTQLNPPD